MVHATSLFIDDIFFRHTEGTNKHSPNTCTALRSRKQQNIQIYATVSICIKFTANIDSSTQYGLVQPNPRHYCS